MIWSHKNNINYNNNNPNNNVSPIPINRANLLHKTILSLQ